MTILHIGRITNYLASGVAVTVPLHAKYQSKYARVALYNLAEHNPSDHISNYQVFLKKNYPMGIKSLPEPFNRADLVVFHELYHTAFSKISSALKKDGIPYIIVPHGGLTIQAQSIKKYKKVAGNYLYFKKYIDGALAIQYLSENEYANTILKNKDYFIRGNGTHATKSKHSFSSNGLKIIYLGRLDHKIKGLDILLDAVSIIKSHMIKSKITLTLCGPISKKDSKLIQEKIHKNKLNSLVTIDPAVFGKQKVRKLLAHDYFIQTSRSEGQPMGLLEALGLGLPCIVTRGTGFYDYVNKEKIGYAAETNSTSLADAITRAYSGRNSLKIMGKRAAEYISSHYGWEYVGESTILDYEYILSKGNL